MSVIEVSSGCFFEASVYYGNCRPPLVEREGPYSTSGVVYFEDARPVRIARILDDIKPILLAVLPGEFKLHARQPHGPVLQATFHRLHFNPALRLVVNVGLDKIKPFIA